MTPTQELFDALLDLLAADATTLAPAVAANEIHLAINAFSPGRSLTLAGLTPATFTGSTEKSVVVGAQEVGFDPVVGEWFIQIKPPIGGWYWECTVAPGASQTVYGAYLTTDAAAVLLGSVLLPTPVIIEDVGDSVSLGVIRFYESDLLSA